MYFVYFLATKSFFVKSTESVTVLTKN